MHHSCYYRFECVVILYRESVFKFAGIGNGFVLVFLSPFRKLCCVNKLFKDAFLHLNGMLFEVSDTRQAFFKRPGKYGVDDIQ